MAIFDMSSGKIQSESTGITCVSDYHEIPSTSLALQEVCASSEDKARSDDYLNHIRELLKKL